MPERLLLPSAKSGILLGNPQRSGSPWWRWFAVFLGIVVVVVGAADATSRATENLFNEEAGFVAFAPAAALLDPSLNILRDSSAEGITPTHVTVPSIGVRAAIEPVGKKSDGSMDTPKKLGEIAWYQLGAKPGEPGSAVFAGHVNNALGMPGVFKELSLVRVGDVVQVAGENGEELSYIVEEINEYLTHEAPLAEIFATRGPSRAVLITCEGEWDEATRTFDKRLVVTARLAQ